MKDQNQKIIELEEKVKNHREHTKGKNKLLSETGRVIFEQNRLRYENKISIVDYGLDLFRQFLYISATGYLGLFAVPAGILKDVVSLQTLLLRIAIVSISFIVILLVYKIALSTEVDALITKQVDFHRKIMKNEDDCQDFCAKQLEHIAEIKKSIVASKSIIEV